MMFSRTMALSAAVTLLTLAAGASAAVPLRQIALAELPRSASAASGPAAPIDRRASGAVNRMLQRPEKFAAESARDGEDVYIVRLRDLPVASYDGRVQGYPATRGMLAGGTAKRSAANDAPVRRYRAWLAARQDAVLGAARSKRIGATLRMRYTDALNGFTVRTTQAQARALSRLPEVAYVQRAQLRPLTSDRGPRFIGAGAAWEGHTVSRASYRGEGIVVGVLDSGINSDHPSFAAVGGDGYAHRNPLGDGHYLGDCAAGSGQCNAKLIGVWSWPLITGEFAGIRPANGEDYNGHGSHTAGTAAGNVVDDAPLLGSMLGDGDGTPTGFRFDRVSGVAPHANLIAYQVCHPDGGCPDEAVLAAVEQAIADGVDVINFSIGGVERHPWRDPLALAFLSAREAGIAVAASAGNAGPGFYTLSHSAPWYLSVAATTHDRVLQLAPRTLTLAGGATAVPEFSTSPDTSYGGISAAGIVDGRLVDAATAGDPLCAAPFAAGTFSAAQIVVCRRGQVARLAKASNVLAGGAGGFILVNAGFPDDEDDLANDTYPLPGLQLHSWDGQALLAWMGDGGSDHRASIPAATITRTLDAEAGDRLAEFSSRGPSDTFAGSLAPMISAPGVDIYAAYADEHPFTPDAASSRDWAAISGTSMASPHVAGALALLRQAHPDWTPAELQSAVQMTASETVRRGEGDDRAASTYRAGAGRIDVHAAIDAGLVMDETAARFVDADPEQGGDVLQLNLPQLVDGHCRDVCTWVRTVTATRDGTWTVDAGNWTYDRWNTNEGESAQNGVKFEAVPSRFTLRRGESRALLLRVDLTDAQFRRDGVDHVNSSEERELWGRVALVADDPAIPAAHWPVSVNFDHGVLPKALELGAHRDAGSYRLNDVRLPALRDVAYRTTALVAPQLAELELHQDIDHVPPQSDGDYTHANTYQALVDVPAGSARLVVENLANLGSTADVAWKAGWATVYVGIDANGNGRPDFDDETLCVSNTEVELNYCSFTDPDPGRYWVFVNNVRTGLADGDPTEVVDRYRLAIGVVPRTSDGRLRIAGPATSTGTPVALDIAWALPSSHAGDVVYGGFDVGSAASPGTVGFVPLKITRGADDVDLQLGKRRARPGDVVDVRLAVRENLSGADRAIELQSLLSPGLTVVPGSVRIDNPALQSALAVDGNAVRIAGTQRNSERWPAEYVVSTSRTDALCRTPIYRGTGGRASSGGFVGLVKTLGLVPDFGGRADLYASDAVTVPLAQFWGAHRWALYDNAAFVAYPNLQVSPQGWVILEPDFGDTMYVHQQFPYLTLPYTPMLGVLWKGRVEGAGFIGPEAINALATPLDAGGFDPAAWSGITVASSDTTHDVIFEWSGARSERTDFTAWPPTVTAGNDRYDFDLILNRDYRYGAGEFEIMMAYGDVDFGSEAPDGAIGVQGYTGPLTAFGPLNGDLASGYAYDDLDAKIAEDLVVCYDYRGPQATRFGLQFKVRVSELAAGTSQSVAFTSAVEGMPARVVEAPLAVAGNLAVAPIGDRSTVAGQPVIGIPVVYHDDDGGTNTIGVASPHATAQIHGHAPGSMIDLVPEPGFVGTTEVFVTVTDTENPDDRATVRFLLTVRRNADGTEGFFDGFE